MCYFISGKFSLHCSLSLTSTILINKIKLFLFALRLLEIEEEESANKKQNYEKVNIDYEKNNILNVHKNKYNEKYITI